MNYIKQLQADNAALKARISDIDEALQGFSRLLNSSKHNGVDMHGERSDWISTGDALTQLQIIDTVLKGEL